MTERDPSDLAARAILRDLRQSDEYLSPHKYVLAGILAERKRCAEIVNNWSDPGATGREIAAAIMEG